MVPTSHWDPFCRWQLQLSGSDKRAGGCKNSKVTFARVGRCLCNSICHENMYLCQLVNPAQQLPRRIFTDNFQEIKEHCYQSAKIFVLSKNTNMFANREENETTFLFWAFCGERRTPILDSKRRKVVDLSINTLVSHPPTKKKNPEWSAVTSVFCFSLNLNWW